MPLRVNLVSVSYDGSESLLSGFYVGRQEDLKSVSCGIHEYSVSENMWPWKSFAEFKHEYSEGAGVCTNQAINSLPSDYLPSEIPEEPVMVTVSMDGYYGTEKEIFKFYINKDDYPEVDTAGIQRYGIYYDVWPIDPVAAFDYVAGGNLQGCIIKALETMEAERGNGNGNEIQDPEEE